MTVEELGRLLARGERAAFHGPPAQAVEALAEAVRLAEKASRGDEAVAATWLLGLSLAAGGRYGSAMDTLRPLLDAAERPAAAAPTRLFGALAAASLGSVRRQLGRHAEAREVDTAGLALADGQAEAAFGLRLGLAADAVGLGDVAAAHEQVDLAVQLLPDRPTEWWRQRVRYDWVRAEIALLEEDPEAAAEAAETAVTRAERAQAPRHVAKSLLFLGVAQVQRGDEEGVASLRRAATLAEGLGALPLVWRARALLGAYQSALGDPDGDASLAAARSAVLTIAADLPEDLRADWLARPDLLALLGGAA